jgi:hypothetical protein
MPCCRPSNGAQAVLEYLLIFVFAADMAATCFVAVYDNENLVTDLRAIRAHYLAGRFWLDVVTTVPVSAGAMMCCSMPHQSCRHHSIWNCKSAC